MSVAPVHTLRLEGELSIRDCSALAAELLEALQAHDAVAVDATAVSAVDVSVLQVMVSAHRSAELLGRWLRIEPVAGPLAAVLAASGIRGHVHLDGQAWTRLDNSSLEAAA